MNTTTRLRLLAACLLLSVAAPGCLVSLPVLAIGGALVGTVVGGVVGPPLGRNYESRHAGRGRHVDPYEDFDFRRGNTGPRRN